MEAEECEGETEEQRLLKRGRELNVGVREQPHDLQLWLQLAAFQDTLLARFYSQPPSDWFRDWFN